MQTAQTYQQPSAQIFLNDIYVPSLTGVDKPAHDSMMQMKKQHDDVDEFHRFLESNCDCV